MGDQVTTIERLKVGDAVQDAAGTIGEVIGFGRDTVKIDWGGAVQHYTNSALAAAGIVRAPVVRKAGR